MTDRTLNNPEYYLNRELSQVEFIRRVLQQMRHPETPVLERLRFLCISCTILDEFFEVRVASLKQRQEFGDTHIGADGLSSSGVLERVREKCLELVSDQYRAFSEELVPALEAEGIRFLPSDKWTPAQHKWLEKYFRNEVIPVLSPLGLDPVHPFPRILNKSLNFAVLLEGEDAFGRKANMALVRAPRSLPRVIQIPGRHSDGPHDFVFLSSVLQSFVDQLFTGIEVKGCYQFRVTRNSELYVDEEEVEDLALALKGELLERNFAKAVRLEIAHACPKSVKRYLATCFDLAAEDIYPCHGPVNLNRMVSALDLIDRPELSYPPFRAFVKPELGPGKDLFAAIQGQDQLLHHPYDSFLPVIELLRQAVIDPEVLAIKQTLYRTGEDSPFVSLLVDAARAGKDVTAVIELRARFDESENIELANRLQEAGVQVVYGVVGHKTHAKMLLIVRRERKHLRRYVHLGTGNYHHKTAGAYTDLGLITANEAITADIHELFHQLTGVGRLFEFTSLFQAPFTLHDTLLSKISREAENVGLGKNAQIMARMNGLTEPKLIRALYRASQAGVKIDLVVRGPCCLRPGVEGISENIRVRSLVGRFLEHGRVYFFLNDGEWELFAASADWMERNMYSRVEACFPIIDQDLKERARRETLDYYIADNCQSWQLQSDGSYQLVERGSNPRFSAQEALMSRDSEEDQYAA